MATSAESERRVNEETRAAFPPGGPSETQPGAEPRPEAVVTGTNGLSPGSTEIAGRRPEGCASDDRPPISDRPTVPPNALQCYVITAPIRCFYRAVLPRPSDWRASSSEGAEWTTCASFHYPRRSITIDPSVGKAFRCVCLSVCPSLRGLQGKQLELSTLSTQSMAGHRYALILGSKGQRMGWVYGLRVKVKAGENREACRSARRYERACV